MIKITIQLFFIAVDSYAIWGLFSDGRHRYLADGQGAASLTVAAAELGIGRPEQFQTIKLTTKQALRAMLCPSESCEPRGGQVGDTIYLSEDMDFGDPFDESVVVHEMVHYIQWWKAGGHRGGEARDCWENISREVKAYAIQQRVLERAGHDASRARFVMENNYCLDD